MSVEQLFILFVYAVMGLGAWSTSTYRGDGVDTPFLCFVVMVFWPVLLFMYSLLFIFTGKKACDE